jgi:hypothetical protein
LFLHWINNLTKEIISRIEVLLDFHAFNKTNFHIYATYILFLLFIRKQGISINQFLLHKFKKNFPQSKAGKVSLGSVSSCDSASTFQSSVEVNMIGFTSWHGHSK